GGIPSLGQPLGQHARHFHGGVGKDVVGFDQGADLTYDISDLCLIHSVKESRRLTKRQALPTLGLWKDRRKSRRSRRQSSSRRWDIRCVTGCCLPLAKARPPSASSPRHWAATRATSPIT